MSITSTVFICLSIIFVCVQLFFHDMKIFEKVDAISGYIHILLRENRELREELKKLKEEMK